MVKSEMRNSTCSALKLGEGKILEIDRSPRMGADGVTHRPASLKYSNRARASGMVGRPS